MLPYSPFLRDHGTLCKMHWGNYKSQKGWKLSEEHGLLNQLSQDYEHTKTEAAWVCLGPLHICYGYYLYDFCGTPNSESGYISDSLPVFKMLFLYWVVLSSLLMRTFTLSFVSCFVLFGLYLFVFWNKQRGYGSGGKRVLRGR